MELFAKPILLLYLIPALLAAGLAAWLGLKLKNRLIHALFGPQAYAKLTAGLRPATRWRGVLLFLALFFLFVALAGPQWGTEVIEAQGTFAQAVIAVDVSASMRAQDLKPDRLDNAKNMLRMLVSNLKDERIGVLAFTSQAYIQCPITTDADALTYFISSLQPDMLPVPGTSLAAPVQLAARMLSKYPGQKALILLTDGEDHSPDELKRVLEYKKDKEGKTVVSKLDENTLLELAKATGGVYIPYTTPAQVAAKVEAAVKGLDRSVSRTAARAAYKNRYAFPLIAAMLCLAGYLLWPRGRKPAEPKEEKESQKR